MGSADAAGLAFLFRNRVGEHFFGGSNSPIQFETMNLETRKDRIILNSWIPKFQINDQ